MEDTGIDGRRFLASMLHEVRTPIQTIIGTLELLKETSLDTEQKEYARQIEFSADVLLNLANDVLDYTKMSSKEFALESIPFDIASLTEHTVDLVSIEAYNKGLEVMTSIGSSVPETVTGDPTRVQQVMLNLLKNAVKFTERGYVRASLWVQDGTIRFEVADSGIGVDDHKKQLIFKDFYQADASTTRKYGGTGLGLAICKNIVSHMGGTIGVRDNPGGGSVFWFCVPLVQALPDVAAAGQDALQIPQGTRVLLVDDSPLVLDSMTKKIHALGIADVAHAQSGAQALEVLLAAHKAGTPFTVALIDMVMGEMDGWRLASNINADPRINGLGMYLIVPEGQMGKDAKMKMLDWFDGYLYKPLKRAQLRALFQHAFTKTPDLEPLEDAPDDSAQKAQAQEDMLIAQGSNILVVEDHPMNRKLICTFLQKFGAHTLEAENGQVAVQAISANPETDVVFMDIQMPVKNGIDATVEIRRGGYKGIIIACTANNSQDDFVEYRKMGINDILVKPFKKEAVRQLLEKWQVVLSFPAIKGIVTLNEIQDEEAAPQMWDEEDFLDTAGGDRGLACSLLSDYMAQTRTLLDQLHAELGGQAQDFDVLHRLAHTLKGSSATISAHQLADKAKLMDEAAKSRHVPPLVEALAQFEADFAEFKKRAAKWRK